MKTVKNWVYGAKTPDVIDAVNEAIYRAHQYRNKLCELELAKRARHEEILQRLAPNYVNACERVEQVEQQLRQTREEIQAERVKQRTKQPRGVELFRKKAAGLKQQLRELRAARKAAKQAAYEDAVVDAALKNNTALHKSEVSQAKQVAGLYWGTEALIKQSCESFHSGAPPRFLRYEGEGQLAVQFQGGIACEDMSKTNTICYIDPTGDGKHAHCYFRIGSDEKRKPIFARIEIVLHRPLPEGRVKWVYLERRKLANRVRWSLRFTIECVQSPPREYSGNHVVVHTGWRSDPGGLRAATWRDARGNGGTLVLPHWHLDQYDELDQVKSQRDHDFNEAKERLRDWLATQSALSEWLAEAKAHLHAWRSPRRMVGLVHRWRSDRVLGDEEILPFLEEWRKQDKRLWQHERRLSVRIVRRRQNIYREFASGLSQEYDAVIVTPIDSARLCENTQPEELERDESLVHRRGKWAAVSELTRFIREKFPLRCVELNPKNISRECSDCGHHNAIGRRRKVQCGGCGLTYDVDENAVTNTLARGEAAIQSGALLDLVAAQEDRTRKALERLAKKQEGNRAARVRRRKAG
jgi:hypothetical protein